MNESIEIIQQLRTELKKVIFGQDEMIDNVLTVILSQGHVLIEAVPGMGKTRTAKALGQLIQGSFKRIQFTPDLMPGDIVGTTVYNLENQSFEIVKGPLFANVILADEINRAPAKTQSALLQAMEERKVTISGKNYDLSQQFFVIATQNPLEMEGTYPLPEAQLDRFMMKIKLDYPINDAEKLIYRNQLLSQVDAELRLKPVINSEKLSNVLEEIESLVVDDKIIDYVSSIIQKTRTYPGIAFGASPRSGIHLLKAARVWAILQGRDYVVPDDIKDLAISVLAHRIILEPESELEGITSEDFFRKILAEVVVYS